MYIFLYPEFPFGRIHFTQRSCLPPMIRSLPKEKNRNQAKTLYIEMLDVDDMVDRDVDMDVIQNLLNCISVDCTSSFLVPYQYH